jgi:hypothetical protein
MSCHFSEYCHSFSYALRTSTTINRVNEDAFVAHDINLTESTSPTFPSTATTTTPTTTSTTTTTEQTSTFKSSCSAAADRRGPHQNVIGYSIYGSNFSEPKFYRKYLKPFTDTLRTIPIRYPGSLFICCCTKIIYYFSLDGKSNYIIH